MKNRFGFIPIVLPAIVMVLIIGLINLTGPQAAQAQGNVEERDARLSKLTLTYADARTTPGPRNIPVPLTQKDSGSMGFLSSVADYTASVDSAVTSVTVAATAPTGYVVRYYPGGTLGDFSAGADTWASPTLVEGKNTFYIGVFELGADGADPAGDADSDASYMIELTKREPEIGATSPQLVDATGLTVTFTGPPADGSPAVLFRKNDGGGQIAFNAGIEDYVAYVPYTAQSFTVNATPGTNALNGNSVMISRDRVDGVEGDPTSSPEAETSTVTLGPGGQREFTITVKGDNASVDYTLKVMRLYPQLDAVTLTDQGNTDNAGDVTAVDIDNFAVGDLQAKSAMVNLNRSVPYEVDRVTVAGVECGTDGTADNDCVLNGDITATGLGDDYRATSTIVRPKDADSDNTNGYQVDLKSGETSTVVIQVRHWLPTESGDDAASMGAEARTTYNLNLGRRAPILANLATAVGSGIHVVGGDALPAGDNLITPIPTTPAPPDPDMTYKIPVRYDVDRVTLRTADGLEPNSGNDPMVVTISPSDDKSRVVGHQVYLNDAGKATPITVTVKSTKTPTRGVTVYKLQVTRTKTHLDDLNVCMDGGTSPCASGDIDLVVPGTTTPARTTPAADTPARMTLDAVNFDPSTTTYYATTSYATKMVRVDPIPEEADTGRLVAFTMPKATTTQPLPVNLVVGDNPVKVDVGVKSASLRPNTTTYTVNVMRSAPTPSVQFTLLDKNDNLLGEASYPFKLDAQSRSYDFVDISSATFSRNDFLFLNSIKLVTDNVDDGVTVSVNNGVQVRDVTGRSIEVPASADLITLEFEVRYKTGAGDAEDASTHIVVIRRPENSKPTFPANSPLRNQEFVLLVGERFSPAGINPPIELPYATGGNGALTYVVEGDEAKGTARIPANLDFEAPSGTTNGRMTGTPTILPQSDAATHYLILKVSDSDGIEDASDEDTIAFSVRFVRDRSQVTPGELVPPDVGELFDIVVLYDNMDGDNERDTSAKLEPKFDPDRNLYLATVPTDADTVDIHALASSTAMVALNDAQTSDRDRNVTRLYGTGTLHKWSGHKIQLGTASPLRNRYEIDVTDNGESETYTLDIVRELNTAPRFESSSALTLNYFEGIELGTGGDLPAEKLPVAVDKSGNGASSTWMYSMKRRLATSPSPNKNDFLGLKLGAGGTNAADGGSVMSSQPGKNPPYLSGTPTLDTDDPSDTRLSDSSEVNARYTVQDSDKDMGSSDTASVNVDVFVHRNVALMSYSVDGDSVSSLGNASRMYRGDLTYSYMNTDLAAYTYNGVAHNATMATIVAVPWDNSQAAWSVISPADADTAAGHQVALAAGPNPVTVRVTNGNVSADHVINISRPGLQASSVELNEYSDSRSDSDGTLTDAIKLTPAFNRGVMEYTAEVETWVSAIRVAATPVDINARVSVNTFEIPSPPGYSVVNLPNMGDTANVITVGVSLANAESAVYTINVTRKADTAPEFKSEQEDLTRTVDRALRRAIELPEAEGGNGDLTYSVNAEELPPGLTFDPETREIAGTPTLDEGYSSDYEVTYTVKDADGNTAASDSDSQTFVITITHDDVPEVGEPDPVVDPADRNKLSGLVVTYDQGGQRNKPATLSPAFAMDSGGPYSVRIPHDAQNVQVEPIPADTEAVININNVRVAGGTKLVLPPQATIVVSHPDLAGDMTYTLNTVRTSDTVPTFGDATIDDMTYVSGEDIDAMTLPAATLGDGALTYSLVDHEGRIPEGLVFTAGTRTLSGRPILLRDAIETNYRMTYTATDENGDDATLTFMITVCEADSGCEPTMPEPNPGSMPMGLEVSISGNTATLTWQPGDDAMRQFVGAVDPTATDIFSTIRPAPFGDDQVAADADMYVIEDLLDGGADYAFVVAGWDGSEWHVAVVRQ